MGLSRWSKENRSQLHQWQLWLSLERGADGQQHLLSESQRKLCCDAKQDTQVTISEFQRSVAAALVTRRGRGGRPLSLPAARRPGRAQTQWADALKRRLLAAVGWRVISVPFYEWDGFARDSKRQTYLERASPVVFWCTCVSRPVGARQSRAREPCSCMKSF